LEVIKSPVKQHLPTDAIKIALEVKGRLIKMPKLITELNPDKSVVFVVGAVAKGNPTM
jgi:rRNA small subunit pseudouridine methyltransferase Nep1